MMQHFDGADGPMNRPVEAAVTETEPVPAADHAQLRSCLLGSRKLAAPALAWWQIWDVDAGRWTDVTVARTCPPRSSAAPHAEQIPALRALVDGTTPAPIGDATWQQPARALPALERQRLNLDN
jgi:hypothetical protein